jgi:predicted dehydrogenase
MKQIKAVVIGYGDRGSIYSRYSLLEPTQLKIVGVVDKNLYRLELAKKDLSLDDKQLFTDLDDFLEAHIDVDLYINSTMDQIH